MYHYLSITYYTGALDGGGGVPIVACWIEEITMSRVTISLISMLILKWANVACRF